MKGDSLIMSLILAGGAAYVIYLLATNQIGPVQAAGASGQFPLNSSGSLPMNCPGDPGCPGTTSITGGALLPEGTTYGPAVPDSYTPTISASQASGVTPISSNPLTITWTSSSGIAPGS